jgi:hypothetical protein
MSEMVERVARALADCALEPFDAISRQKFMGDARAAIEAMREPTEAMLERGDHGTSAAGWASMIDEALK